MPKKLTQDYLIAIGANLPPEDGSLDSVLSAAIAEMAQQGMAPISVSRFFRTPCFPAGAGPDYLNACVKIRSDTTAKGVLSRLHSIEAQFGRERNHRWGSRTLDLDLLACGDQVLPDLPTQTQWRDLPLEAQKIQTPDRLILPHPRLQDRAFVLVPLNDIAPDWRHPVLGHSVSEMLRALPQAERSAVVAM